MDNSALKKTCSICGQQKPFSSFLQLGGSEGAIYGNVCADCRAAGLDKPKPDKEREDSTRNKSGEKIDAKAKVFADVEKKQRTQAKEEEYELEKEKEKDKEVVKEDKIEKTQKFEKERRETFLDKRSFLSHTHIDKERAVEIKERVEQSDKATTVKEEEKLKSVDFTAPFIPAGTGAQIKFQSENFNYFRRWVGKSAPIMNNLNAPASSSKEAAKQNDVSEESISDYIEKTWKPNKRR